MDDSRFIGELLTEFVPLLYQSGYSPNEYLRVIRMKKAAELLLTEDLTVAEISYKVGINDPYYFSKCFKNQFGVSPSAYRKKLSEDENEPINDADV